MANPSTYCTHRDLKDIYPNVDEFDTKTPIYGWTLLGATYQDQDTSSSCYIAENTGLVTNLFIDGQDIGKREISIATSGTITSADTAEALSHGEKTITLESDNEQLLDPGWIISITENAERMLVTDTSVSDTITVRRGFNGTTQTSGSLASDADIYRYANPSALGNWVYSSEDDVLILVWDSNPTDLLVESGEDYSTLITRIMSNASRYFDSRVDATLPRDQWKDKEGNYDYFVIRTTALISAAFLLKSQDPLNPMVDKFEEEYNLNLGLLNGGQVRLSNQNTADSSQGVIRDVVYTSGGVRPVDTRGNWHGTYDMIKVKIITGGAMGAATFSAWVKNSDKLGIKEGTQVVTEQIINGDYQTLSGGLQIRFGFQASTALAIADNEWEIEVWGAGETVDNPVVRSVKMTRGWSPNRYR